MTEKSFKFCVDNAKHFLAIGQTRVWLEREGGDKPWQFVTKVSDGCSYRNGIPVSIQFEATHPCGLEFLWSFDMEPNDANGKSGLHVDTDKCATVKALLPPHAKRMMNATLQKAVEQCDKLAAECREYVDRHQRMASELRTIIAD